MKLIWDPVEALFLQRLNRFAAMVELEGRQVMAHVPNSGRMRELLRPRARVLLAERSGPRKTAFDLLMAYDGERLVSIDSRLPPLLLEEALLAYCCRISPGEIVLDRQVPVVLPQA